ncbi:hypothetical protein JXO52_13545 [bacterium]|nr:hypothetical protein [bacterium]
MIFTIIMKEILHRKQNFFLACAALTVGTALYVLFYTVTRATNTETVRLTRDMGFNLRIVPGDTDINRFWLEGFSDRYMPESYANRFLEHSNLAFAHVLATLHYRMHWRGMDVVLTGLSRELEPSGAIRSRMSFAITPGTVYLGHTIAAELGIAQEDMIEIEGRRFRVAKVLSELGNMDDIRIFAALGDVQEISGHRRQINEITALQCLCLDEREDALASIREQLKQVLPDAEVIMNTTIAQAREQQRRLGDKYFILLLPGILGTVFIWVGVLTMMNVKERKSEIGIYSALGYSSFRIISLFLVRGIVMALLGAAAGFVLGTLLAFTWGPHIFTVTPGILGPDFLILVRALIYVPAVTILSILVPIVTAVTEDPARVILNQ